MGTDSPTTSSLPEVEVRAGSATTAAGFASADVQVLRELGQILLRSGYIDSYHGPAPLHLRLSEVKRQQAVVPAPLRALIALFLLGEVVAASELRSVLTEGELAALRRLGILLPVGAGFSTAGLLLLPLLGQLLFIPQPGSGAAQSAYFGDDTAALLSRLSPGRQDRCLDLSCGAGAITLRCCSLADRVVAIESSPAALACAELNFAMNDLDGQVELRRGEGYAALQAGEQFDFVAANPALSPLPPSLLSSREHADSAGSDDGLQPLRQLLAGLPAVLVPRGRAQIVLSAVGGEAGPALHSELVRWVAEQRLQAVLTLASRTRLQPPSATFEALAQAVAVARGLTLDQARGLLGQHFAARGAHYLYLGFLTITAGGPFPGLVVVEQFRL